VADTRFTLRGAPAALVALLAAARAQGTVVTRTKAAKLLYLADLKAVELLGRPCSGVHWRWLNYGPFSNTLLIVEDDLVTDGIVERETTENYFGGTEYRLRLLHPVQVDVDEEFAGILEKVVIEYGHLAASTLRDLTYQTPPMLEAQRDGARGEHLDLLTGRPVPDVAPVLQRFRGVLHRLKPQSDEGDMAGLSEEVAEWGPARRSATRPMIDD
jgi:uncharacterized phage-associated protein